MSWYVYIDDASHGPYEIDELKKFLKPSDFVAKVGTPDWMEASKDPELAQLFVAPPVPEDIVPMWYVTPKGKPQRGRFTPAALANMLKKNTLQADDLVRHETWDRGVALREMKAYQKVTIGGAKPDELTEADWLVSAPGTVSEPKAVAQPAPAAKKSLKDRMKIDFEMTPVLKIILIAVAVLPIGGYAGYEYLYRGSDLELRMKYGSVQGDCTSDESSRNMCTVNSSKCGCKEKGQCDMPMCVKYKQLHPNGP